jgi:hypothetical protein
MRATAVAFCFNAPRFVSRIGPVIAGKPLPEPMSPAVAG